MQVGLGPAKGKDFATSLGPVVVTPDEFDGSSGTMVARVNGEERSRGNLADMYHSWDAIVAQAARNTHLRPGDMLGSGTVGTGCILEHGDGRWLQRGRRRRARGRGASACSGTVSLLDSALGRTHRDRRHGEPDADRRVRRRPHVCRRRRCVLVRRERLLPPAGSIPTPGTATTSPDQLRRGDADRARCGGPDAARRDPRRSSASRRSSGSRSTSGEVADDFAERRRVLRYVKRYPQGGADVRRPHEARRRTAVPQHARRTCTSATWSRSSATPSTSSATTPPVTRPFVLYHGPVERRTRTGPSRSASRERTATSDCLPGEVAFTQIIAAAQCDVPGDPRRLRRRLPLGEGERPRARTGRRGRSTSTRSAS